MNSPTISPSRRRRIAVGLPLASLLATLAVIAMHLIYGDPWGFLAGSLAVGGVLGALPLLIDDSRDQVARTLERHGSDARAHADELRDRIHQLEDFQFLISRDLQEPLRMLDVVATQLRSDLGGLVEGRIGRDLDQIESSSARIQGLVRDLMRLARVTRMEIQLRRVSLDHVADEAIELLRDRIEGLGAHIERPHELPSVLGSRPLLVQLYQNLIQNALTFSAGAAPRLILFAERDESADEWILVVRDAGIGIDPTFAKQVFEPFRRLHDNDVFEGSGVGLTICRTIAERHGGRIWVEPHTEAGTEIRFAIPNPRVIDADRENLAPTSAASTIEACAT